MAFAVAEDGAKAFCLLGASRMILLGEGMTVKSESEYRNAVAAWLSGIRTEILFWNRYMMEKGAGGAQPWEDVISDERPFRLEEDLELDETSFLDVGSGPFSRCGLKTDKTRLHMVAVDALAPVYVQLKKKYGIVTGITPSFGMVEILDTLFSENSFDIVHMSNSLDHCVDPILGIYNLLYVCKIGGKIILRHTKNEAVNENWEGLHQWNLCATNNSFFISNKKEDYNINDLLSDCAEIECYEDVLEKEEKKWKYDKIVIHKRRRSSVPVNFFKKVLFEALSSVAYDFILECNKPVMQQQQEAFTKCLAVEDVMKISSATAKREATIRHYAVWSAIKRDHPALPEVGGIELTNNCNLRCPNCCTPTSGYPKGFATEQTVMLALRYAPPGGRFSFHRQGEPFLHRDFLKYLRMAGEMGFHTVVSTNGILLDASRIEELLDCRPHVCTVSLHTKKSLAAFVRLAEYGLSHNCLPENFQANVLSHNRDAVCRWAEEMQIDTRIRAFFKDISSHSWAGNVAARKTIYSDEHRAALVRRCWFIRNNHVDIRWDGTVVACCLDSENVTQLGHVQDLPFIAQHRKGYALCKTCDEDWMHG